MNDWREYLIEVNAFDLGESLGDKSRLFATISLYIEDPMVLDDPAPFRSLNQLKDFASAEDFQLLATRSPPFHQFAL